MKKTVKCSGCGKEHEIEHTVKMFTGIIDGFPKEDITFKPVVGVDERILALCDSFRSVHPYLATTLLLGEKQWDELRMIATGELVSGGIFYDMRTYKVDVLDHLEVR
jgi:hypothetical protein